MKNTFGNNLTVTLFGESHGEAIGAVIDGITPGIAVNNEFIETLLSRRRPHGKISTPRSEADPFQILSGVFDGKTTGTPICIIIPNGDTQSKDYEATRFLARPSHADYTANCKYHGFEDYRGGGHFSGRITAALVAVGGILIPALESKGIKIGTHIKQIGSISDREFNDIENDISKLNNMDFAVLDDEKSVEMNDEILKAREQGDSIGGILETAVIGLPCGLGEPWFDTVEGMLSHALFSIPAVKGVEFGAGFNFASMYGTKANDSFNISDGAVTTKTNNSGGINGGITNGMPIIFRTAFRPTPTISKPQNTIDMSKGENAVLEAMGRHDPCIVHRARVVADSVTAIVLTDMLIGRYGTDWLVK
jgi:chorismate synthase